MEKKLLQEMRFMMERLESPRMTDTEYQKKKKLMKESSEEQEVAKEVEEVVKSPKFDAAMEDAWSKMSDQEKESIANILKQEGIIGELEEDLGDGSVDWNKAMEVGMALTENINETDGEKTLTEKIGKGLSRLGQINVMLGGTPIVLLAAALGTAPTWGAVALSVAAGMAVGGILWWLGDKISGKKTAVGD